MGSRRRLRPDGLRIGVAGFCIVAATVATATSCTTDSQPKVVKPGCPAIVPGTSDATDDYPDLVVWQRSTYIRQDSVPAKPNSALPKPIRLDHKITTVGCSLADPSSTNGHHIAPGQWPDRTATGLPEQTPLYAARNVNPACAVVARNRHESLIYVAVGEDGKPRC